MTRNDINLDQVGMNIAWMYGASYEYYEILDNGNVRFYYNDHGDKGCCDLEPNELSEYA